METYGKILLIAMPFFCYWCYLKNGMVGAKEDTVRNMDMISSLSSGVTNVTKDVLGLKYCHYQLIMVGNHIAFTHIQCSLAYLYHCFYCMDFAGYWVHRFDHSINFFWNSHIVHHSSEEFNLACALRQSISVFVKTICYSFYCPLHC